LPEYPTTQRDNRPHADVVLGDRWTADAMKPITTGDQIASDFVAFAVLAELYLPLLRVQIVHAHVGDFKQ
jgi:hypothetical protein